MWTVTTNSATPASSVTGAGLTFDVIDTVVYVGGFSAMTLWHALSSGGSGSLTITPNGGDDPLMLWAVDKAEGLITTGSNGADAIEQFVGATSSGSTDIAATLSAFASAGNAAYAGTAMEIFGSTPTLDFTAGTGFTSLGDYSQADNTNQYVDGIASEWRADEDTGVDGTWNLTADGIGIIAIELVAASGGAASQAPRSMHQFRHRH